MFQSFINIFKIPDLRRRILITMGLLCIYRVGYYLPVPGVDVEAITRFFEQFSHGVAGRLINMVSLFAGGALRNCTVFALGVMPYISASIIFQLLTSVIPSLEKLAKEGPAGRRKISQYTRYATILICIIQSFVIASYLQRTQVGQGVPIVPFEYQGPMFTIITVITLTTGTAFLMWLGEQITEYGIGNGVSIIIMVGIISRIPRAVKSIYEKFTFSLTTVDPGMIGIGKLIIMIVLFILIVLAVVLITQGQRRIPVQQARLTRGRRIYGGQRTYLPLRVNQAGVIPIIFAQSMLIIPSFIFAKWLTAYKEVFDMSSFLYNFVYVLLIIFFCYFYTAIIFNPVEMADNMKNYGSFIPGIRPGKKTADYLEDIMIKITLAGAIFLAFITIFPLFLMNTLHLNWVVSSFYGGTGLLIVVGVALDVVQKIESHLIMSNYEGFMRNVRIRGRI